MGKIEEKVQSMPITLIQMREVSRAADPDFSFILALTGAANLGPANRVN